MRLGTNRKLIGRAAMAGGILARLLFAAQVLGAPPDAGPGFSSDRMLSHLTGELGLSDAQVQQVKKVLDAQQEQMTATFGALKTARQALQQAGKSNPVDEAAIRSAAQAVGQAEGDSTLLHARMHSQILPILTDDQKQKLESIEEEMPHQRPHSPHSSNN